jgi:prepilin peptidase CpaA
MTATQWILIDVVLLTAVAGLSDLRTGHIPNSIPLFGCLVGLCANVIVFAFHSRGHGASLERQLFTAGAHMGLGLIACSLVPLFFFQRNAVGGGDVKLFAVIGLSAGPYLGLEIQLGAFVLAALYAPARLAYEGHLLRLLKNAALVLLNPLMPEERRRPLPPALLTTVRLGPAIFVATTLVAFTRWSGSS